jgi:hypothetical protein
LTALQALRRAVVIDPNFAEAHGNLGFVLHEQGKFVARPKACALTQPAIVSRVG